MWERRHRVIVDVALAQAVVIFALGLYRGLPAWHAGGEAGCVAALALFARFAPGPFPIRASYATLSLLSASAMLVHQADGVTEWHFHFFVMVALITLYQDWAPFAVAITFVVLHHAVVGSIDPSGVYGTPAAIAAPWKWALAHGAFVLAAAAVNVAGWRLSETQGVTDGLTGLPNRLGFAELVDRHLARQGRVAVLFVDLDRFKLVNDSLGHDAGDEVLRVFGDRVRDVLRAGEWAARLGGDEFAVMLSDADHEAADRMVGRLQFALGEPVYLSGLAREVHLRASIGIAMSEPGIDGVELIRRADIAMYSAKHQGGGRASVFEHSLEELRRERAELVDDLHRAVTERQLRVLYQPAVDLQSGGVRGVEALLRWDHPTKGDIPPGRFIPIAEETGAIVEIGEWVLRETLRQAAEWRADGIDIKVAVNVSARQLNQPGFVELTLGLLAQHRVDPSQLILELTESVLVADLDEMARMLRALRAVGVRIAIDDFGTGYSSMSYLSRLPVDVVKIDHSFVRRLGEDATDSALVRTVIEMAATLGIDVVAEGVEHDTQADHLIALQCPIGQGFLWSHPVPPGDIPALVRPQPAALAGH